MESSDKNGKKNYAEILLGEKKKLFSKKGLIAYPWYIF